MTDKKLEKKRLHRKLEETERNKMQLKCVQRLKERKRLTNRKMQNLGKARRKALAKTKQNSSERENERGGRCACVKRERGW